MSTSINALPTAELVRMHSQLRKQGDTPQLERLIRDEVSRRNGEWTAKSREKEE